VLGLSCFADIKADTLASTDANIVTGLDFSHSIGPEEQWIEREGLALAIVAPEVLEAIRNGRRGRIGFAVYGWHLTSFPLVPWTLIGSEEDALIASLQIRVAVAERIELEKKRRTVENPWGKPTSINSALMFGTVMLLTAPFSTPRSVMNIVGNGSNNVGREVRYERDRAVEKGLVINGVVLGADDELVDYFRTQVIWRASFSGVQGTRCRGYGGRDAAEVPARHRFQFALRVLTPA